MGMFLRVRVYIIVKEHVDWMILKVNYTCELFRKNIKHWKKLKIK